MISTRDLRRGLIALSSVVLATAALAAPETSPIAEVESALASGDGIAAGAAVKRALAAGVPRDQVAALAGEAELLRGDLAGASSWLAPGRFAPGTRARGLQALARLQIRQGDLGSAARTYQLALRQGPPTGALLVDIGRLHYRVGQHHKALAAAARAVEIDPGEARALEFRGQLLRDARGPVAALPWFERALEKRPDDLALLGEYAATLAEAGRNADMLAVARRMVELDPRHPQAYFLQAVLAARSNHDDLARRLLARTGNAYENAPAGRLLAGILELRTGNPVLAASEFEALVRHQPDNTAAAVLLGRALLASGDAREVVARLGPLADRADASAYLLSLVGRAYERLGDRRAAARYLDRSGGPRLAAMAVLPVEPERVEPGWRRDAPEGGAGAMVPAIRRLLVQGRNSAALAAAGRAGRRYPGSADVEALAGDVALMTGNPAAALEQYARAAEIRRDYALVERMVAALRMLGREQAALVLLADYVALNPRASAPAALLGRLAAQRGDRLRGAIVMSHASQLRGEKDPWLMADLAEIELASGNLEAARERATRGYLLQRGNQRAARVLSRIKAAQGGEEKQVRALRAKAPEIR